MNSNNALIERAGAAAVLSPCGRCREFIKQIHGDNLDTEVILSPDRSVPLKELLPMHDWYCPVSLPSS